MSWAHDAFCLRMTSEHCLGMRRACPHREVACSSSGSRPRNHAHAYVLGDKDQASLVDPRRDVLETHRQEDFVIGSKAIAERTDAKTDEASGMNQ